VLYVFEFDMIEYCLNGFAVFYSVDLQTTSAWFTCFHHHLSEISYISLFKEPRVYECTINCQHVYIVSLYTILARTAANNSWQLSMNPGQTLGNTHFECIASSGHDMLLSAGLCCCYWSKVSWKTVTWWSSCYWWLLIWISRKKRPLFPGNTGTRKWLKKNLYSTEKRTCFSDSSLPLIVHYSLVLKYHEYRFLSWYFMPYSSFTTWLITW
jgi:hypothetical protein